jgi:peptidoglycan hydrolase-like protein with peptidoglycan-binding domain
MMKTRMLGVMALGLIVAACGTDPQERVAGGAAAGAATGAGVGALGGPAGALAGAGIGAAAGATTGAATSPEQVNLGRPLWEDPEVRVPGPTTGSSTQMAQAGGGGRSVSADPQTRELQQALRDRGFDPGPVDGIPGPRTREAVSEWQRQNNMPATGRPDQQMLSTLGVTAAPRAATRRAPDDRDRAYMGGGAVGSEGRTGTGATGGMTGSGAGGAGTMGQPQTGGAVRPNPPTGRGDMPSPSNNPMNDPVGGTGQAIQPGFNQNRDSGGAGGGSSN